MSWKVLEELDARIEKLRTLAERVVRPAPAGSRELVTVLYQEVSFLENDLNLQRQTFYNGDRDTLVIQRLGVSVSMEYPPGNEGITGFFPSLAGQRIPLFKTPVGWNSAILAYQPYLDREDTPLDFQWNYVVNSRQSQYSRDLCSSDMLVGLDRSQMLEFRVPLVIPKSESIEFQVQPIRYLLPQGSFPFTKLPGIRYFVGFQALGYRSMP